VPHDDEEMPEFAVGLRGYDRGQVDEYVATLRSFLAEAHERALAAEQTLASERARGAAEQAERSATTDGIALDPAARAVSGLADRVAEAVRVSLSGAEEAGRELLQQAAAERDAASQERQLGELEAAERGRDTVARARAEAERVVAEAQAEATHLLRTAREEQAVTLSLTEEQVTALRQQADQQQARRDDVLRQIAALRHALDGASGSAALQPAGPGGAEPLADSTTVIRLPD